MLIIGKSKKRRIAARLGFLLCLISLLPVYEFDLAVEVLCNLAYDLEMEWGAVQEGSKYMAEVMESRRKGNEK